MFTVVDRSIFYASCSTKFLIFYRWTFATLAYVFLLCSNYSMHDHINTLTDALRVDHSSMSDSALQHNQAVCVRLCALYCLYVVISLWRYSVVALWRCAGEVSCLADLSIAARQLIY